LFIEIVFIEVLPQLFHRRLRAINKGRLGSWFAVVGRRRRRFLSLDLFFKIFVISTKLMSLLLR